MNKPIERTATSTIREELHKLLKKHKKLDAEIVLREANKPSSPLHSHFEWDDGEAAHRYRLQQAEELIIRVKITVQPAPQIELGVPEFFSSARARREGLGYAPRSSIKLPDVRETADVELAGWQARYLNLLDMVGQGERSEEAIELFDQLKKMLR